MSHNTIRHGGVFTAGKITMMANRCHGGKALKPWWILMIRTSRNVDVRSQKCQKVDVALSNTVVGREAVSGY
jgi:hypothetical protein